MRHAILITVVLVGCRQQSTPLSNPFLAPDRVSPPGTRTPPPGTALPYYDTAPPSSIPPTGTPPTGATPGGTIQPPIGSWQTGQRSQEPAVDSAGPRALAAANSTAEQITVPADDERERITHLASGEAVGGVGNQPSAARPFPDIGDLPQIEPSPPEEIRQAAHSERGDRSIGDAFRAAGDRPGSEQFEVQTASFESPAPGSPAASGDDRTAGSASPGRKRYDYDPDYAWLQGKLEHSRASGEWKLRYIPIDGETDKFGGSVVLADPDQLGELAAGDFVRVRGGILKGERDESSFAPLYRIEQIQPLAD